MGRVSGGQGVEHTEASVWSEEGGCHQPKPIGVSANSSHSHTASDIDTSPTSSSRPPTGPLQPSRPRAWEGGGAQEGMTLWMWGEGPGQGGVEPNNSKQRTQAKPPARAPQGRGGPQVP